MLGQIVGTVRPNLKHSGPARVFNGQGGFWDGLVTFYLTDQYYRMDETERRNFNKSTVWGSSPGVSWHKAKRTAIANQLKDPSSERAQFAERIVSFLGQIEHDFVLEIGCGTADFLNHLELRLAQEEICLPLRGADLSEECLDQARLDFPSLGLFHSDAISSLRELGKLRPLVVAIGTLEYLSESELHELLGLVRDISGSIALLEPANINLSRDKLSKPRGNYAFSHNYPLLIRRNNFLINHESVKQINEDDPEYLSIEIIASSVRRDSNFSSVSGR